ncbi:hypothetical protein SSX86_019777 [Deinandra increscens subsp. villosa]|uniref:2-isopropylmalate synthase n=1 Tax=Deinandra increscens subsp. villosa TaxID=3103831 RepID=A0AAP0D0F4_9ASTR
METFLSSTPNLYRSSCMHNFKSSRPNMHLKSPISQRYRYKTSPMIMSSARPFYVPNRISDPNYVRILDTTLRDGEQSPGVMLTPSEKLDIARQLAKLGIDVIEAGFPASSNSDFEAVKLIAQEVGNAAPGEGGYVPVICCLARCTQKDIEKAWEAVKYAKFPRILMFIATSDIHMKYKLKMSKSEVVERARSMVRFARSLGCYDIEFAAEDASRSEKEFLYEIFGEVIKAGVTTITLTDTVGYSLPSEFGQFVADIRTNTPGIESVIIAAHCHNDLGLASANALQGCCSGARQLELTINGIGERAGNASLEEVVMAIKCKGDKLGGLTTGIDTRHILMASKMVEEYTRMQVQPHKAIVGANAFAHESGIHQDGMLKNKMTYEIMTPEDIGLHRSNELGLTLGKHSGRHALKAKLFEYGYDIDGEELHDLFWQFKSIVENKKVFTKDDLLALLSNRDIDSPTTIMKNYLGSSMLMSKPYLKIIVNRKFRT